MSEGTTTFQEKLDEVLDLDPNPVSVTESMGEMLALSKIHKDLRKAGKELGPNEVRYLVDTYYQHQDSRKRMANQIKAMKSAGEPTQVLEWSFQMQEKLENSIKAVLKVYALSVDLGRWCMSQYGIAEVITAGLISHIDITKAATVGSIWRFAGMDPSVKWEKKTKRPWNAALKRLCYLIGDQFRKRHKMEKCFYGPYYADRKQYEVERNLNGGNLKAAERELKEKNIKSPDVLSWLQGRVTREAAEAYLAEKAEYERQREEVLVWRDQELAKTEDKDERKKIRRKAAADRQRLNDLKNEVKPELVDPGKGLVMLSPGHIDQRAARWTTKLFLAHFHEVAYRLHYGEAPPNPYIFEHGGGEHVHKIEPPNWPMK